MKIIKTEFVGSFGALSQLPKVDLPEVGFVGRSNVGKSSLLNKLLGVRRLALISSKPGKTRNVNIFRVNDAFNFMDLPGYGFARVSRDEKLRWRLLVEGFLLERTSLRLLILLMDARHGPQANDKQMILWLSENRLPFLKVFTKADKLSNNKLAVQKKKCFTTDGKLHDSIFCSSVSGMGIKQIWNYIEDALV